MTSPWWTAWRTLETGKNNVAIGYPPKDADEGMDKHRLSTGSGIAEDDGFTTVVPSFPDSGNDGVLYTGQFSGKLELANCHADGWLIWSRRRYMWHRRNEAGGAAGYTSELAEAGVFDKHTAQTYGDGETNEAIHVSTRFDAINTELCKALDHTAQLRAMQAIAGGEL